MTKIEEEKFEFKLEVKEKHRLKTKEANIE